MSVQHWFILVYRATMGDQQYEGLDWLLPLSRRDSWQLLYGGLRRCCNAPYERTFGHYANVNGETGGLSRVMLRPLL